jgi:hypothetical protein
MLTIMQIQQIFQTVDTQNLVIQVPASFVNHQVEILMITLNESTPIQPQLRRFPPQMLRCRFIKKSDAISSLTAEDWGIN